MDEIKYIIKNAKQGSKSDMLELITMFMPKIKRYIRKLYDMDPCDAENDLILKLIETIIKMPEIKTTGQIYCYVLTALKHEYIALLKRIKKIENHELSTEFSELNQIKEKHHLFLADIIDLNILIETKLTPKQKTIVLNKIYLEKTDLDIAMELNVTRQAITKIKKSAYKKIKKYYIREPQCQTR